MIQAALFKKKETVYKLRPYQEQARDACFQGWNKNRSELVIMPTGTGKTILFAAVCDRFLKAGCQTMVIAHREELLKQAADKLASFTGVDPQIEKAELKADPTAPLIVASVQTLSGERLKKFRPDLVVIDEAHHAKAKTYENIINYYSQAKIMGVTATPERADNQSIADIFDEVAFQYELLAAIGDGWLVRPKGLICPETFDLAGMRKVSGDISAGELDALMMKNIKPMALAIHRETKHLKTLIFMPGVASLHMMAEELKSLGIKAIGASGQTKDREDVLEKFSRGVCTHLVNCQLFTEGYDEPSIECVVIARPTISRGLYAQMIGRGLRTHPGKSSLLIVEFTYNSKNFSLVDPFELFVSDAVSKNVRAIAKGEDTGATDYYDLVMRARKIVETDLHRVVVPGKMRTYDPMGFGDVEKMGLDGDLNLMWRRESIEADVTEGQRGFLRVAGFNRDAIMRLNRGQASMMIKKISDEIGRGELQGYAARWFQKKLKEVNV